MVKNLILKQSCKSTMTIASVYLKEKKFAIKFLQRRFAFSTVKRIDLSPKEQKAIVAFFILRYLQDFSKWNYRQSPLSIRERIASREIFTKYILDQVNQITLGKTTYSDIRQLGIDQQNYKEVLNGFTIGEGMIYDSQVFTQNRMSESIASKKVDQNQLSQNEKKYKDQAKNVKKQSLKEDKIIFNPTIHSVHIINQTFSLSNKIIYGDKGVGKSFSYLLYSYLSGFIIRCLIDKENCPGLQSQLYKQVLITSPFYKIKKIFYVSLKQQKQFAEYTNIFERQSQGLVDSTYNKLIKQNLLPNQHPPELALSLLRMRHAFSIKDVKSICVVDQANQYFTNARKIFTEEKPPTPQKAQQRQSNFRIRSRLLIEIKKVFLQIFLSCSDNRDAYFLKDILDQKLLYNFYSHQKGQGRDLQVKYTQFLGTKFGNIQLYGIYWFELTKYLYQYGIKEQRMKQLRPLFNNLFGLQDLKLTQRWSIRVKPLDIRQVIQIQNTIGLLAELINNKQETLILEKIKQIKTKIENYKRK